MERSRLGLHQNGRLALHQPLTALVTEPTVDIYVGADRKLYKTHHDLLSNRSSHFALKLSSGVASFEFLTVEEETFDDFTLWIYGTRHFNTPTTSHQIQNRISLSAFARRLRMDDLADYCMDQIRSFLLRYQCSTADVKFLYAHTTNVKIRVLFCLEEVLSARQLHAMVGKDRRSFSVHRDLLCDRSEHFRAALLGKFQEAQSGIIEFPDEKETTFMHFLCCIYGQNPAQPTTFEGFHDIVALMCFSKQILLVKLENQCMNSIRAYFRAKGANGNRPAVTTREISVAYDAVPELPKLRLAVCLEAAIHHGSKSTKDLMACADADLYQLLEQGGDFAADLCKALVFLKCSWKWGRDEKPESGLTLGSGYDYMFRSHPPSGNCKHNVEVSGDPVGALIGGVSRYLTQPQTSNPLSAVASIVGVVGFAGQLARILQKEIDDISTARERVQQIVIEIRATSTGFNNLKKLLLEDAENANNQIFSSEARHEIDHHLRHCNTIFRNITVLVAKAGSGVLSQVDRYQRRMEEAQKLLRHKQCDHIDINLDIELSNLEHLRWPWRLPKLQQYLADMDRLKLSLVLIVSVASLARTREKKAVEAASGGEEPDLWEGSDTETLIEDEIYYQDRDLQEAKQKLKSLALGPSAPDGYTRSKQSAAHLLIQSWPNSSSGHGLCSVAELHDAGVILESYAFNWLKMDGTIIEMPINLQTIRQHAFKRHHSFSRRLRRVWDDFANLPTDNQEELLGFIAKRRRYLYGKDGSQSSSYPPIILISINTSKRWTDYLDRLLSRDIDGTRALITYIVLARTTYGAEVASGRRLAGTSPLDTESKGTHSCSDSEYTSNSTASSIHSPGGNVNPGVTHPYPSRRSSRHRSKRQPHHTTSRHPEGRNRSYHRSQSSPTRESTRRNRLKHRKPSNGMRSLTSSPSRPIVRTFEDDGVPPIRRDKAAVAEYYLKKWTTLYDTMHHIAVAQSRDWDRTRINPYRQWSSRSESHSARQPKIVRLSSSSPVQYGNRPFYGGNDIRRREWFDPHQPPPPPPPRSQKPMPFRPNPVIPLDLYHQHIENSLAIPRNRHFQRVEQFSPGPSQRRTHRVIESTSEKTESETGMDVGREEEVPEVPRDDQHAYAESVPDQEGNGGENFKNTGDGD
ncbi:MAG: hypothetical protein Q9171_005839 [Xanthocarpia ochracea]